MDQPLVSILIPCFNAASWLAATLESAFAQTWPRCEIILVDDGSHDASPEIARRFASARLRVVTQKHSGASAARNRALREARGEFLQFLDADDLISPGKIAAQVALLASRPHGTLATCRWGRFEHDAGQARFVDEAVFRDFQPLDFLILAARTGAMMHPSAWLTPRAVAEHAGPWNESLTLNDDGEYFCRVALASAGLAFCVEAGAQSFYRSGVSGSLSRQRTKEARRSQFRSLDLMARHVLAAEDSPRTRLALADMFQRFIHDYFPETPDLMRNAAERVTEFGGSSLRPAMGPKTAALARLLGWKNVWRLKHLAGR